MDVTRNRSLDRGITLLEVLARDGACSLSDLHKRTGLAKSTIRRLLATMMDRQVVRRSLSDQKYRTNVALPSSRFETPTPDQMLLVAVAMPFLMELTVAIDWPSDLHFLEADWMRIVDSTRPLSPFHLYRGQIDRKINQFGSASGLACLSVMAEEDLESRIGRLEGHPVWGLARCGMRSDEFKLETEQARRRGYGIRLHDNVGETVVNDGLAAIAVPIVWRGQPVGAATLLWPQTYLSTQEFASAHLQPLTDTVTAIMKELEELDRKDVKPESD